VAKNTEFQHAEKANRFEAMMMMMMMMTMTTTTTTMYDHDVA
jgi:hypothetical protein